MSDYVTPPQDAVALRDTAAALTAHALGTAPLPTYRWTAAHHQLALGRERFETSMALGCVAWSSMLHQAKQAVRHDRLERALRARQRTLGVYREG